MNEHLRLIGRKLEHLSRMRAYLEYSLGRTRPLMPIASWSALTPEQHETLAAFRVRFSEYQEQLGKTMRAVAIEEEQKHEPFSAVLAFMEKLDVIESVQAWKEIRDLRNAINHEYEEDSERLTEFFLGLTGAAPNLFAWHDSLVKFCQENYSL